MLCGGEWAEPGGQRRAQGAPRWRAGAQECEHWRHEILRGVAKKIAEIQNAALGEPAAQRERGHAGSGRFREVPVDGRA